MRNPVIIGAIIVVVLGTGGFVLKDRINSQKATNMVLGEKQEQKTQLQPSPTPNDVQGKVEDNVRKAIQEKLETDGIKNKTENNIVKPSPTFTPTPTESLSLESYTPINEPPVPTMSIEQQKATKIISISDSLGNTYETNCQWSDTHYECPPKDRRETVISIKATPQLTFTINAQDPNNRPLTYHYYYAEGCRGEGTNWITNNSCTSILKTNELGLRTFSFYVKNDDSYGSVGLDANTSLYYRMME